MNIKKSATISDADLVGITGGGIKEKAKAYWEKIKHTGGVGKPFNPRPRFPRLPGHGGKPWAK